MTAAGEPRQIFDVSVVVCTYDRYDLFVQSVRSCLANATRLGLSFEIVVADNSPSGHAEEFVSQLRAEGIPIAWVPCSPPNISVARNAGIGAAQAPLVAFLDDDLEVVEGWLDYLVATMSRFGADVALGPLYPRFVTAPPSWDGGATRFTRTMEAEEGVQIPVEVSGRNRPLTVSTACSIWRVETCFTDAAPFNPVFGASGGEDLDLFWRIYDRGCRFVWSPQAAVYETIPHSRTRFKYQLMRAFSGGQTYASVVIGHRGRRAAVKIVALGVIQVGIGLVMTAGAGLLTVVSGGRKFPMFAHRLLSLASAVGKIAHRKMVPLYHLETSLKQG